MNARENYTLAYRNFRATKGSVGLRDCKPIRAAWITYRDEFLRPPHLTREDPLGCSQCYLDQIRKNGYTLDYVKAHIRLLYHFNTDYLLSFPSKG